MNAREQLSDALQNPGLVGYSKEEADELIEALLQEHTAKVIPEVFEAAVKLVQDNPGLRHPTSADASDPNESPTA